MLIAWGWEIGMAESQSSRMACEFACCIILSARGSLPTPPFHSMEVVWDAEPPKDMPNEKAQLSHRNPKP